jgi:hypothetical protein
LRQSDAIIVIAREAKQSIFAKAKKARKMDCRAGFAGSQ